MIDNGVKRTQNHQRSVGVKDKCHLVMCYRCLSLTLPEGRCLVRSLYVIVLKSPKPVKTECVCVGSDFVVLGLSFQFSELCSTCQETCQIHVNAP